MIFIIVLDVYVERFTGTNVFGWGAGTYYDLGKSFRFRFNIEQMSGKMHYTAADPTGIPAAEGMSNRPAPLSKITMFLDGEF